MSALGVVTGQATWTIAAAAGFSALLVASAPAFEAVKLAGAAYLVCLGLTTILHRDRAPHTRRLDAAGAYRYALAVAKAGDVLRRSRVRHALDAVTGTVLVALGVRVAV